MAHPSLLPKGSKTSLEGHKPRCACRLCEQYRLCVKYRACYIEAAEKLNVMIKEFKEDQAEKSGSMSATSGMGASPTYGPVTHADRVTYERSYISWLSSSEENSSLPSSSAPPLKKAKK